MVRGRRARGAQVLLVSGDSPAAVAACAREVGIPVRPTLPRPILQTPRLDAVAVRSGRASWAIDLAYGSTGSRQRPCMSHSQSALPALRLRPKGLRCCQAAVYTPMF